jgi:hypothetical protein
MEVHDLTIPAPVIHYSGQAQSVKLEAAAPRIWYPEKAPTGLLAARPPFVWFNGTASTTPLPARPPFIRYTGDSESTWLSVAKPYFAYVDDLGSWPAWWPNPPYRTVAFGRTPGVLPPLEVRPPALYGPDPMSLIPAHGHVVALNGISLWFKVYCPRLSDPAYAMRCNDPEPESGLDDGLNEWMKTSRSDVANLVQYAKEQEKKDNKARSFLVIGHADTPTTGPEKGDLAEARANFAAKLLRCAGAADGEIVRFVPNPGEAWVPQTDARESQSLNRRVDIYLIDGRPKGIEADQTIAQKTAFGSAVSIPETCPNDIGLLSSGP